MIFKSFLMYIEMKQLFLKPLPVEVCESQIRPWFFYILCACQASTSGNTLSTYRASSSAELSKSQGKPTVPVLWAVPPEKPDCSYCLSYSFTVIIPLPGLLSSSSCEWFFLYDFQQKMVNTIEKQFWSSFKRKCCKWGQRKKHQSGALWGNASRCGGHQIIHQVNQVTFVTPDLNISNIGLYPKILLTTCF